MRQKIQTVILGLIISTSLFAQKTTFYKDENLRKETSEKKAKFKKIEFYNGDTLVIQSRRISDNLLIAESKWLQDKPVGIWTKFDMTGNLISSRNFGILVYSKEPIDSLYDNTKENENCTNCKSASYPTGNSGMFQFLAAHIKYPSESIKRGSSGTVYIRFIIDKEGNAVPHSIMRGVDPFIDMEAWQIIEKMPKWKPATKNGEPIESYWILPMRFILR
ncbi:MAG: energy transducer TonB [Bacteroidetes bacterium]|nr:MAG: energy transducer TonB [Bacteroidota bacterium]